MNPPAPGPPGNLPAPAPSDDDRQRAVDTLTRHFTLDRLSTEELEARVARVYRAASLAELHEVLADLEPERRHAPGTSLAATDEPERVVAVFSGREDRITGAMPRTFQVRARLGYVELDLTDAQFADGVSDLDIRAFAGYVQLRLPEGVRVESRGRGLFGFFAVRGRGAPDAKAIVRIRGRALFGFAECFVRRGERD